MRASELRIGQPLPRELGDVEWAFLTAWNPGSVPRDEDANRAAQERLVARLESYSVLAGHAEAQDGSWREPSLFVIGIPRWEALEIARECGQAAFLAGEPGGLVQLIWTR